MNIRISKRKSEVAIGELSYAPAHYYPSIRQKISTACGGRFIQSTKVPHSIKNAFVLNRHQNKKSRRNPTHNKSINLSCHLSNKKYWGRKTLREANYSGHRLKFSVTRIEYYQRLSWPHRRIVRFNIVSDCVGLKQRYRRTQQSYIFLRN